MPITWVVAMARRVATIALNRSPVEATKNRLVFGCTVVG